MQPAKTIITLLRFILKSFKSRDVLIVDFFFEYLTLNISNKISTIELCFKIFLYLSALFFFHFILFN